MQTLLERRCKAGFNLLTNYTYARLIDDNPAVAGGKPSAGPYPQLANNWRLERGNSDVDVRHRWVLMANYELPFGKQLTGLAGIFGKGWQLNAIAVCPTQKNLDLSVFKHFALTERATLQPDQHTEPSGCPTPLWAWPPLGRLTTPATPCPGTFSSRSNCCFEKFRPRNSVRLVCPLFPFFPFFRRWGSGRVR